MITRRCLKCERDLPLEDFYLNPAMKDGYEQWCRSCHLTADERRRAERKAAGQCHCGRVLDDENFKTCSICRARVQRWAKENPEQKKAIAAANRQKVRDLVFGHYGRKCACCGEAHREFLTIDHIGGGGNQHRRETGRVGNTFYAWLIRKGFPPGYQTLCYNCNCSLGHAGYCPHQRASQESDIICPDKATCLEETEERVLEEA